MTTRLQRRAPVHVRRDAAVQLSNGRVLYDALFSRVGLQGYGESVEYRPPEEVFSARSLASLTHLPGVLLHPDINYGTSFGPGSYPVRGCTGERAVEHTDHIHTAGKIMVWDDEWNGLIERDEVGELSLGYTIEPDNTPGEAPPDMPGVRELGRRFSVVHRDIVGDHCAGVPAGNAGSARVVTDARGDRATRQALAEIAAARMDARPLYHDLGRWPARTRKDDDMPKEYAPIKQLRDGLTELKAKPAAQRLDGLADLLEKVLMLAVDNPDMASELKSLAGEIKSLIEPAAEDPAPEPEAPADEAMPPGEEDDPAVKADALRRTIADEVAKAVARERSKIYADAEERLDERADVLTVAKAVLGADYKARKDGKPLATVSIMEAVIAHHDAKAMERIEAKHGKRSTPKRDGAIEAEFERVREAVADAGRFCDELIEGINETRKDALGEREQVDARLTELSERMRKHDDAAKAGRKAS